ncbi:hypothetical protein AC578_10307 [Pseudocercospora eumusae]|uniref:AAA+ ATPase domain-containing protein n=1 Tax=Pseudocercospora eumusae TaxID=321146 RepID=A0A139HRM3_9PEZI|nr:hypothetical protein AC578_10307 [Pseudocercospora eumusae]
MVATEKRLLQILQELALVVPTALMAYFAVRNIMSRLDPDAGAKAEAKKKELAASSHIQSIFRKHQREDDDDDFYDDDDDEDRRHYAERSPKEDLTLNQYEQSIAMEVVSPSDIPVTFNDIGGLDEIIEELRESVIYPLTMPHLYSNHSSLLTAPSGVLLYGPPGCGKTMLAKALARESGACFINLHISTLTEKWYGDSNKLVAAVFSLARKLQPTIVFIDEIDAVLGQRRSGEHEASGMVKAEFMTHWDGLASSTAGGGMQRICILGATNRIQDIDEAILRRMPKKFPISLPNAAQRRQIYELTLRDTKIDHRKLQNGLPAFDLDVLVRVSAGMSGSDIKEACRDAAMVPIRLYIKHARANGKSMMRRIHPDAVRGLQTDDFFGRRGGVEQLRRIEPADEDVDSQHSGSTEEVDHFDDPAEVVVDDHRR